MAQTDRQTHRHTAMATHRPISAQLGRVGENHLLNFLDNLKLHIFILIKVHHQHFSYLLDTNAFIFFTVMSSNCNITTALHSISSKTNLNKINMNDLIIKLVNILAFIYFKLMFKKKCGFRSPNGSSFCLRTVYFCLNWH